MATFGMSFGIFGPELLNSALMLQAVVGTESTHYFHLKGHFQPQRLVSKDFLALLKKLGFFVNI